MSALQQCSPNCLLRQVINEVIPMVYQKQGFRSGSVMLVPRQQRDWTARGHVYGVGVARSKYIRSGEILELLRVNPRPEFCNVLAYCECHVAFEYVDGPIMAAFGRFTPSQWTQENDGVATLPKQTILTGVGAIATALLLLHELGLAHTDSTAFNVMYDHYSKQWKLIDMLSCVPLTKKLERLDWWVFEHHLVKPLKERGL